MVDRLHRVVGAAAFGDHLEIRLHFDEPLEPLADDGVVVDQNDAVHAAPLTCLVSGGAPAMPCGCPLRTPPRPALRSAVYKRPTAPAQERAARWAGDSRMYHPRMRSKPFSLPDSGPLLGVL